MTKTTESTCPLLETPEHLDYHKETHHEDESQENVDDDPENIRRRLNLSSLILFYTWQQARTCPASCGGAASEATCLDT